MKVILPPEQINITTKHSLFLAGSIEMGKAIDWQNQAIEILSTINHNSPLYNVSSQLTILNPRRPDWNNAWVQAINNSDFFRQVSWELQGLEVCEKILFYFDNNTLSPISLLELGKFSGKAVVIAANDYLRKGNVDIFCERYKIPMFKNIKQALGNLLMNL